jgi:hypothetical protein
MPDQNDDNTSTGEAQSAGSGYTQADIDRIVQERIGRMKAKYADYDELKAKAARLVEMEKAHLSEQERLAASITALEERATTAERERDEALTRSQQRLIQSEVTALAAAMSFKYPNDIHRLADLAAVSIDESGAVVGVREALEALAKERPDYISKTPSPVIDGAAGGGQGNDLPRLTPAQERAARELGVPLDAYAKRLAQ